MRFHFGSGTLGLIDENKTVTDGTSYFKVIAPSLLFRFFKRKKGVNYVDGKWLLFDDTVIFFIRKRGSFGYFPIEENKSVYELLKKGNNHPKQNL